MKKDNNVIDDKTLKVNTDKPIVRPAKKETKLEARIRANWSTITYAGTTVFYLVLGISLMVCAGTAVYASYKVDMYDPLTQIVKFSGFFVGLCAFVPLGKAVVRR